eukprot:6821407-Pyramimonas_sp.AAC.1
MALIRTKKFRHPDAVSMLAGCFDADGELPNCTSSHMKTGIDLDELCVQKDVLAKLINVDTRG